MGAVTGGASRADKHGDALISALAPHLKRLQGVHAAAAAGEEELKAGEAEVEAEAEAEAVSAGVEVEDSDDGESFPLAKRQRHRSATRQELAAGVGSGRRDREGLELRCEPREAPHLTKCKDEGAEDAEGTESEPLALRRTKVARLARAKPKRLKPLLADASGYCGRSAMVPPQAMHAASPESPAAARRRLPSSRSPRYFGP